jgi:hypothetical protein
LEFARRIAHGRFKAYLISVANFDKFKLLKRNIKLFTHKLRIKKFAKKFIGVFSKRLKKNAFDALLRYYNGIKIKSTKKISRGNQEKKYYRS